MPRRSLWYVLVLVCMVLQLTGCAPLRSRAVKVLLPSDFVYQAESDLPPARVTFKSGYRGDLPELYAVLSHPALDADSFVQPPIITRDGWIDVTPTGDPIQVRLFVRAIGSDEQEFLEVKSITGSLPYEIPSEVRFLKGGTPIQHSERFILRNLKNPYNSYSLRDNGLLLIEVTDPKTQKVWRYLFIYKDFGSRQKISFNVVFNVPSSVLERIGLNSSGTGVGNAAFTMSYSYGYRFRTQNRFFGWMGDKVALTGLLGTSASFQFGDQLFNQLSLGVGIEYYDFFSTNLLMDADAIGNLKSGRWSIVIGFDAVRAADFTRSLTRKLLNDNYLK